MNRIILGAIVLGLAGGLPLSCSTEPKSEETKTSIANEVQGALNHFRSTDSTIQGELDKAAGYAVLPDIGKGGLILGGAYGRGEVYEKGQKIGYISLTEGTVGLQAGGQEFSELIIFKDKEALDQLKRNVFRFTANASAVAAKEGAGSRANYQDGVAVFTHVKAGLMAEASVGGQKLNFESHAR